MLEPLPEAAWGASFIFIMNRAILLCVSFAAMGLLTARLYQHCSLLFCTAGSYGPGISADGGGGWPGPKTPIPGLYVCGDSTMPGIGVPAAAAR